MTEQAPQFDSEIEKTEITILKDLEGKEHFVCNLCLKGEHGHQISKDGKKIDRADCKNTGKTEDDKEHQCQCGWDGQCVNGTWEPLKELSFEEKLKELEEEDIKKEKI